MYSVFYFRITPARNLLHMPTRQTTLTLILEGELHKQGPPRRNPLGRMGTGSNATIGGWRCYVTFIDDHSHYAWIFPIKKRVKCSRTFKSSRAESKKKPINTIDAYDRMEERSTSPTNSSPTSKVKAFRENYCATTQPNKMDLPKGRIGKYSR